MDTHVNHVDIGVVAQTITPDMATGLGLSQDGAHRARRRDAVRTGRQSRHEARRRLSRSRDTALLGLNTFTGLMYERARWQNARSDGRLRICRFRRIAVPSISLTREPSISHCLVHYHTDLVWQPEVKRPSRSPVGRQRTANPIVRRGARVRVLKNRYCLQVAGPAPLQRDR